ncbi:MAG: methylenetetrahydrofolate reductase [NAD(P)H], partial [Cyclobacteriaceae bacterium]
MKVVEHIKEAKEKTLFSLEIIPPKKGDSIDSLFAHIDPLMEFKPPFIDVTYHREEFVYKNRGNGLLEKKTTRKRPGTVGICAAIKNRYDVDPVPHIICGGFTKEETENALIDLNFLGIDNVLALRGDAISTEKSFKPEPEGNAYAIDLVHQLSGMNQGQYLDDELQNAVPTNFCIGVAGYPEKHFEAPNLKSDLSFLKQKIDAGAEYIVTQLFFDNQKYFEFVEKCRKAGINVPIIPGLKPITIRNHMNVLPSIFHIDIPDELHDAVEQCNDNAAVKEVGVEWGIKQAKELMDAGVPVLHFYSMG